MLSSDEVRADVHVAPVEPLDWDTRFFGIPIGRIEVEGMPDAAILTAERDARALGLRCLYASLDPTDRHATIRLQQLGYRFVEAATMFELLPSSPPIPQPDDVEVRLGRRSDLPALEPMVEALAPWSRFAVDPRFGLDAAHRLQRAAIERAAGGADADDFSLLVAEGEDGIVAFVTRRRQPRPTVDAVGTTARGSGAARHLIEVARGWARPDPLLGGDIAARNVAALRYVAHCGYRVHRVRYVYHRWLDEHVGGAR